MAQVLVRQPALRGTPELRKADVISRSGTTYRVKYLGSAKVVEVDATQVLPAGVVYGGQPGVSSRLGDNRIPKQYPGSRSALGNTLR